jgi:hypothetical protein
MMNPTVLALVCALSIYGLSSFVMPRPSDDTHDVASTQDSAPPSDRDRDE